LPDICSEPPPEPPSPPVPLPANIYLKGHSHKINRPTILNPLVKKSKYRYISSD
jgi:hypothetical protein